MGPAINVIFDTPAFNKWERDWIEFLVGDFAVEFHFDPSHALVLPRSILAVSIARPGNEAAISRHLSVFQRQQLPIGLIHLSDEWLHSPMDFYDQANFVFRNYFRPDVAEHPNCRFFGIGYRSGLVANLRDTPIEKRQTRWSFAGQPKTSRYAMLKAATQIPGGKYFLTRTFDDPRGLGPREYAEMLSDSVFVLCPRGFFSLDCFRLYEALEAGAIPIVEDPAFDDAGKMLAFPQKSYWHQAFGEGFPCPRIGAWENLSNTISDVNIEKTCDRVRDWWRKYKCTLKQTFSKTISLHFRE
jgi:hypothetical protein